MIIFHKIAGVWQALSSGCCSGYYYNERGLKGGPHTYPFLTYILSRQQIYPLSRRAFTPTLPFPSLPHPRLLESAPNSDRKLATFKGLVIGWNFQAPVTELSQFLKFLPPDSSAVAMTIFPHFWLGWFVYVRFLFAVFLDFGKK